jgi:hypothetical protein
MHAASKATVGAAFAKPTPHKPHGQDAKAKKAAAAKRKAAIGIATASATRTRVSDGTKPPTKK